MRPIRDRLAELLRRERLGSIRPLWQDMPESTAEQWRLRADHIMRLASEVGLSFSAEGDPIPLPQPANPLIWRAPVADANAERLLRAGQGVWELVKVADGAEKVLTATTLQDAALICGLALVGDKAAMAPGNMTRLAMGFNVLRLDAAGMEMDHPEETSDAA